MVASVFGAMLGLAESFQTSATGFCFNECFGKGLCPAAFAGGQTKTMIFGGSCGGTTGSGTSARHLRAFIRLTADAVRPNA